ncbi:helix-turn-helix transcriptional regulator [Actinoplanes couchii]|uniref:Transcriptional regulator n=1 Tax=Actinoplanes couchii TaxID=403638 RepID=A0ABQ3XEL9_9ACTN|nr:helix-turn-helix transcriptional regulator [Actinoplanes couchii]MDR6319826.1 transcriptional regulator with XRE-family HTH domain [Actinoplanes couchii]GID56961.1 transcriptional regulator [Actinoplanes couchii]
MSARTPNAALGAFLRSRRDRLTPAQAGIDPFPGPRRVPGLRKDELAVLAGISSDHYSRLEQGRQSTLSDEMCAALARALRLDDVERRHLRTLARPTSRRRSGWEHPQRPEPGMLRMMSALDHLPALLLGRRSEVLARNTLLDAVLGEELEIGTPFARWLLLGSAARDRIVNWADFAQAAVGGLRYESGRHPDDRRLAELIAQLRTGSEELAGWWDDQGVTDRTSVEKVISHPSAGRLRFHIEAVTVPHHPEQRLVVYTVEPGSPTAKVLPLLGNWGADDNAAPQPASRGTDQRP